jgi:LuxR family transcriptional regulator, activator of conjugal transfer of Ti plasmids
VGVALKRAMRVFQEFVDGLGDACDPAAIHELIRKTLEDLDLPMFAYVGYAGSEATTPLIIANYPDGWAARYHEQAYYRFDGVLRSAHTQIIPFAWGSRAYIAQLEPMPKRIFDEAGEFGIRRGFTVPIHDGRGKIATLNVATAESQRSFAQNLRERHEVLHLVGLYFHAHLRYRLIRNEFGHNRTPLLGRRETECLQWAARGKNYEDIGVILGISRRTVVFHLENVRQKFRVSTIAQALIEGVFRGIVDREFY